MSDLQTARILVTGGDGFLGRHVHQEKDLWSGCRGRVDWDRTRPDGQPRRLFDSTRAAEEFGWRAKNDFKAGLRRTVEWYAEHIAGEAKGQSRADHHPRVRNRAAAGS